jgi:hypothetical protein
MTALVDDTTPQLGGTLDGQGNNINDVNIGVVTPGTGAFTTVDLTGDLSLGDNVKALFGDAVGGDFEIYHDGTNNRLKAINGGYFMLGDDIRFLNAANTESMLIATANGSVDLYYDNSKTFETVSGGAKTTGTLEVTGPSTLTGLVLAGKAASSLATVGNELNAAGQHFATANGTSILQINRLTNDGQLIVFYRDTAAVGDITVNGGVVTLTSWSAGHYALWETEPEVEPKVGTIISVTDTLSEWLIHFRYDEDGNKELVQGHGTNKKLGDTWVEEIPAETEIVTKQKTVKENKTQIVVEEIDGKMQQVEKTEEIDALVFEDVPLFGRDGEPVMVETKSGVMKPATYKKPVMDEPAEVEVKPAEKWTHKIERFDHERLLAIEVSNKKGDSAVYGTYAGTDPETGNVLVFAAGLAGGPGVRVTGPSKVGDLLVSNGDGTAVVDNTATMSNCIGKVLRGNPKASATEENLTICILYCG